MYINLKWLQFGNTRNANKYSREVTKSKTKEKDFTIPQSSPETHKLIQVFHYAQELKIYTPK